MKNGKAADFCRFSLMLSMFLCVFFQKSDFFQKTGKKALYYIDFCGFFSLQSKIREKLPEKEGKSRAFSDFLPEKRKRAFFRF